MGTLRRRSAATVCFLTICGGAAAIALQANTNDTKFCPAGPSPPVGGKAVALDEAVQGTQALPPRLLQPKCLGDTGTWSNGRCKGAAVDC